MATATKERVDNTITLRGIAANAGAAIERALLAFADGRTDQALEWEQLVNDLQYMGRAIAQDSWTAEAIAAEGNGLRNRWAALDCQQSAPMPPVEPTPITVLKPKKAKVSKAKVKHRTTADGRCWHCAAMSGHFPGCDRNKYRLPKLTSPKPGSAAASKLEASIRNRLAAIELDERGYIRCLA